MIQAARRDLVDDPIAHFPQATVAAFDPTRGDLPRRKLDLPRTRQYLERLAQAGAPAILVASSTGHGHLRTEAELVEWFTVASQADLAGAARMALLRPEDGREVNERLIGQLAESNFLAVFFRPGTDLAPQSDSATVAAQLQPLVAAAASAGLPVGLYSIPDVSGLPLRADAVAELLAGPGGDHIVAVKVTEYDYEVSTRAMLKDRRLARLKIVQGWDPHLAQALRDGPHADLHDRQRCGVTSGPMALAIFQYLHLLQAAENQQWEEVQACQKAVDKLFAAMQDDPARFADLQRAKYVMGLGHPITGQVQAEQVERLLAALMEVERDEDRRRLAASLDLMGDGPFHEFLEAAARG